MDMSNRKEESKTRGFAKTTEFKPILVDTDEQGLKQAEKIAGDKLSLFNKAVEWCEKHIVVGDLKALEEDMITYFEQEYLEQQGHKVSLEISVKKLMDLFDVNIDALKGIAEEYYSNPAGVIIKNGKPSTRVNRKSYEVWTTDTIENDMVKTANHFIKAYNELAKYTKTYPMDMARITSDFIRFDMRKGELKYNPYRA